LVAGVGALFFARQNSRVGSARRQLVIEMNAAPKWKLIECDPPRRLPDEVVLEESSEPEIDEEIAQRPVFVYESYLAEQIRKRRAQAGGLPQAPAHESFAADSLVGPSPSLSARAPRAAHHQ
jgi:hypothetical protein